MEIGVMGFRGLLWISHDIFVSGRNLCWDLEQGFMPFLLGNAVTVEFFFPTFIWFVSDFLLLFICIVLWYYTICHLIIYRFIVQRKFISCFVISTLYTFNGIITYHACYESTYEFLIFQLIASSMLSCESMAFKTSCTVSIWFYFYFMCHQPDVHEPD